MTPRVFALREFDLHCTLLRTTCTSPHLPRAATLYCAVSCAQHHCSCCGTVDTIISCSEPRSLRLRGPLRDIPPFLPTCPAGRRDEDAGNHSRRTMAGGAIVLWRSGTNPRPTKRARLPLIMPRRPNKPWPPRGPSGQLSRASSTRAPRVLTVELVAGRSPPDMRDATFLALAPAMAWQGDGALKASRSVDSADGGVAPDIKLVALLHRVTFLDGLRPDESSATLSLPESAPPIMAREPKMGLLAPDLVGSSGATPPCRGAQVREYYALPTPLGHVNTAGPRRRAEEQISCWSLRPSL